MNTLPSLDALVIEYRGIMCIVELSKIRIELGQRLPDYIFKTMMVLSRAYIQTAHIAKSTNS